ncbi:hypothetical protein AAH134_26870 [Bacteroides thetaiotaomicron]|nr:hypothetical protein [Bacteroides thetaiotaomicron]MCS2399824.1 hypothetical protein [Bacteroides thetaiotaomicron]
MEIKNTSSPVSNVLTISFHTGFVSSLQNSSQQIKSHPAVLM